MTKVRSQWVPILVGLIFIKISILLIYLSQVVNWSDSELWSIAVSGNATPIRQAVLSYKFIFSKLLEIPFHFDLSNLQTIQFSRGLFAVLGLTFTALHFVSYIKIKKIVFKEDRSNVQIQNIILFCAFVLTNTFFLSQAYRIRSDLVTGLLQLASILLYLNHRKSMRLKEISLQLLIALAILFTTPKGIFNVVINLVFIISDQSQLHSHFKIKYWKWVLLIAVMLLLPVLVLWQDFSSALTYFVKSYETSNWSPGFLSVESWFYFKRFALENPVWLLAPLYPIWQNRNIPAEKPNSNFMLPLRNAAFAAFLFIVLHSDRLAFFILFLLPIINIYLMVILEKNKIPKTLLWAIFLVSLVSGAQYFEKLIRDGRNDMQIQAQAKMENFIKKRGNPVFIDGTGVLPRAKQILVFSSPAHLGNEIEIINSFKQSEVKLIFFANRFFFYFLPLQETLYYQNFVPLTDGVFLKNESGYSKEELKAIRDELDWNFGESFAQVFQHDPNF